MSDQFSVCIVAVRSTDPLCHFRSFISCCIQAPDLKLRTCDLLAGHDVCLGDLQLGVIIHHVYLLDLAGIVQGKFYGVGCYISVLGRGKCLLQDIRMVHIQFFLNVMRQCFSVLVVSIISGGPFFDHGTGLFVNDT